MYWRRRQDRLAVSVSDDTQAVLDVLTLVTDPADKLAIGAFIDNPAAQWDQIGDMGVFLLPSGAGGSLEKWKSGDVVTLVNSPIYTPNKGYEFDANGERIDLGINPSTASLNNDECFGVYIQKFNSSSGNRTVMTAHVSQTDSSIIHVQAGVNVRCGAQSTDDTSAFNEVTVADIVRNSLIIAQSTGTTSVGYHLEGVRISGTAAANATAPNAEYKLGKNDDRSAALNAGFGFYSMWFVAHDLGNDTAIAAFSTAVQTLLDALGLAEEPAP